MKTLFVCDFEQFLWMPYLPPDVGRVLSGGGKARAVCHEYDQLVFINCPGAHYSYEEFLRHPRRAFYAWDVLERTECFPAPEVLAFVRANYPLYSFRREDERLGYRFAGAFYHPLALPPPAAPVDVVFLGRDGPERRMKVLSANMELLAAGLDTRFHLTADSPVFWDVPGMTFSQVFVDYIEYLRWVAGARAILEISNFLPTGFSQRALEALFYGKKLITDNPAILDADFYRPENIFVLEHDTRGLRAFMDTPMVEVEQEIADQYRVENWAQRIYDDRT